MLKVVQINLKHSRIASDNLRILLAEEDIDLGIIQEPYVRDNVVIGLHGNGYKTLYIKDNGKPRSCLIAKNNLNIFLCPQLSTADFTVARLELTEGKSTYIASCYMAHACDAPPREVGSAMANIHPQNTIIIGCDANARHVIWGSSEVNERGESVLDFINTNNLTICNRGTNPTFVFPSSENFVGWSDVIDLTLISDNRKVEIENWTVSGKKSFSDHNWILFNISAKTTSVKCYRNPRRTDWDKFNRVLKGKLPNSAQHVNTTTHVEEAVSKLAKSMDTAFKVSCPQSRSRKTYPPWWTDELTTLRRESRQAFNASFTSGSWQPYKDKLKEYKKAIATAKIRSWSEFCGSMESTKDTARLSRIMAKGHSNPTYVKRDDGTWSNSSAESLEILLKTHFPGCENTPGEVRTLSTQYSDTNGMEDIISPDRISWAINSFSPYKSPGPDGIIPKMLQSAEDIINPWLCIIFRSCLSLNYIPESWSQVRVVFIPKAGRRSHENAKDFRPISLSSFLLKTLERLIDAYIRTKMDGSPKISPSQHAYLKGRSTDTALHEVVRTIERSLEHKQYTLAAFLDIEGAFNNVSTAAIVESLEDLGVETFLKSWIVTMLQSRTIYASMGNSESSKKVNRGTPQGGVISPLLWLLVINKILLRLDNMRIKTVAYADDVVIIVSGLFPSVLSEIMNGALEALNDWATRSGLGVNPRKTEVMLFTTKTKIPKFDPPRLSGIEIPLSTHAKYLGVILDRKLSWKRNAEHRVQKATVAYYTCRKMIGSRWGLRPKMVLWMYTSVIRPILSYGAMVWWPVAEKTSTMKLLYRVQRSACIGITGAMRTCPAEALNAMLHIIPIDLHITASAACSATRLKALGIWKGSAYGHARILQIIPRELNTTTDYCSPSLTFDNLFDVRFPRRIEWDKGEPLIGFDTRVFTDGSKMECGTGAGVFSEEASINLSFKLPDKCSVFQAEVLAIKEACAELILQRRTERIGIFVDSQAALLSLKSNNTASKLVSECREKLVELGRLANVVLTWTPGHKGILGNERADELARAGSSSTELHMVSVATPMGSVKRGIFLHYLERAKARWDRTETCRISRITWPEYNIHRTNSLISHDRGSISRLTAVLTGHWPIGNHARRLKIPYNDHCRACDDAEEEETVEHLLCSCPALMNRRLGTIGRPFLHNLTEVHKIDLGDLMRYLRLTDWI